MILQRTYTKEHITSDIDGYEDQYLIECPDEDFSGLLVFYLHAGLSKAKQAFCENKGWCMSELRDVVMYRKGIYVSPEYRGNSWMNAAAEADFISLIHELKERHEVKQLVLVGASMGATSSLIVASHYPNLVDGVIALCPASDMHELYRDMSQREELIYKHLTKSLILSYGGTPSEVPEVYDYRSSIRHIKALTMPVVVRHGATDPVLPVDHSRLLVEALRAVNPRVLYDEIPDGDHAAPTIDAPWDEYLDFVLRR